MSERREVAYVRAGAGVGFNCLLLPLHTRRARAHHVPRGEALIQRSTYHSTTLHTFFYCTIFKMDHKRAP